MVFENIQQKMRTIGQAFSCYSTLVKTIRRNLQGKKFESEVYCLEKFIFPGAVCFDVGAAYGRYALHMSRLAGKNGVVYCFEPGNYSFKVLKNVIRFHRLVNVVLLQKALSDKEGTAYLAIPIKGERRIAPSLAHLSFDNGTSQAIQQHGVAMTTLDRFCEDQGVERVDFIKCDVEGAEGLFFKGAQQVIRRHRPVILSEIDADHLRKFHSTPEEISTFFLSQGYRIFTFGKDGLQAVPAILHDHNYFFIPSE